MKQLVLIITACWWSISLPAQSKTGITGRPDTAYTLSSILASTLKTHPEATLVKETHPAGVLRKMNLTYRSVSNRKLVLDGFVPVNKNKHRTAILLIHGGGWRSGNRSLHYALAEQLALRGYVCFTAEYRLSTEALYPAAVSDLKSAVRWIRKNAGAFQIDTNHIAVTGHSAGGELAAYLASTNDLPAFEFATDNLMVSSRVNALIDMDGLLAFLHPESGEGDDTKKTSSATYWFGYSKTENPDLWKAASPLSYAGPAAPPTLFINSGVRRMQAGQDDYITLLRHFNVPVQVKSFATAPHSFCFFQPWFDPMVNAIDSFLTELFARPPHKLIIVAKDGSGNFQSVQEAFNAIPSGNTLPTTIFIRNGVYKEKLHLDSTKNRVTLLGEDPFQTILTYDDHAGKPLASGDTINTRSSWSCLLKGDDCSISNITFENSAGFSAGQAVAVEADGDRIQFYNCRFTGNQDVLFTNNDNGRLYFEGCYIEGTTDFIFGSSTAWFERCHIHSKKNSHITAASTPREHSYGYIFNNCVLTGDTALHNVSLGRPWRPYAQVLYMHCYMGPHIKAEGWSNWNNTNNYQTARYAEFENTGPGANASGRVPWAQQWSATKIKDITIKNVLNNWLPSLR